MKSDRSVDENKSQLLSPKVPNLFTTPAPQISETAARAARMKQLRLEALAIEEKHANEQLELLSKTIDKLCVGEINWREDKKMRQSLGEAKGILEGLRNSFLSLRNPESDDTVTDINRSIQSIKESEFTLAATSFAVSPGSIEAALRSGLISARTLMSHGFVAEKIWIEKLEAQEAQEPAPATEPEAAARSCVIL